MIIWLLPYHLSGHGTLTVMTVALTSYLFDIIKYMVDNVNYVKNATSDT